MRKDVRFVFFISLIVTAGVICLQGFWLTNFYTLNRERFEKEINLAFEDAIKKEFSLRNDSIEKLLVHFLMDTSQIRLTSKRNEKDGRMMYQVTNATNPKDQYSFSHKELHFPLLSQQDTNRSKIAEVAARLDREEDLDHHIIFYRTQNLGKYLQEKADQLSFDTMRLRPVFNQTLRQRSIAEDFVFALKDVDNTLNLNRFPDSLEQRYPVISKAFPTYRNVKGENFVRAYFLPPTNYLFARTIGVWIGSVVLLLIVVFAFLYLIRVIRKEKNLSAIKNDFINHITHEFKTPIATVYSAMQALDEFDMAKDLVKSKRYLHISKTELERLSELVTKVLNISLYEQPGFHLKREAVDLNRVVKEVMAIHQHTSDKKVTFAYENSATVWMVKGDSGHLFNSVNNLIDNAIKYSIDEAHINIQLFDHKTGIAMSIADKGYGIKKEHQAFVFDKFYRAPLPMPLPPKGFGLGLNYTKQIVQLHGGWCRVESEFGKGSIFTIGLPLTYEN